MQNRRVIFRIIVASVIFLFVLSSVVSISTLYRLVPWRPAFALWVILTVAFQIPFLLIPLDKAKVLRLLIETMPQNFTHVMISMNLTNVFVLVLSPLLYLLPAPGHFYDTLPFVIFAWVNVVVFKSAYSVIEKRVTIPIADLADSWRPLTILHLSDIHAGAFVGPEHLEKIVDRINEKGGFDLCVVTGDVVNQSSADLSWTLPILEKIRAPMGIFASIGNHEYIDDENAVKEIYSKSSIQLIFESSLLVSDGHHNVRLVGLDYPFSPYKIAAEEVKRCLNASYRYSPQIPGELQILLSHHPDGFRGGRAAGIPLTLAGHTHGGQIIVFGKNIISSFVRYKRGIYRKGDKYLFVNSGLGNWLPFRIGCPCEYALIKVIKKSS